MMFSNQAAIWPSTSTSTSVSGWVLDNTATAASYTDPNVWTWIRQDVLDFAAKQGLTPPPPVRRSPPLEFNRYINASDLLEEFIRWLGTQRVRQSEVMALPIDLFIKWLILRACEQDGEEPNVTLELPSPRARQCAGCGRFLPKAAAVPFDRPQCAEWYFRRAA